MGDKFENIKDAVIATRGGIATQGDHPNMVYQGQMSNVLNHVGHTYGPDVKHALEEIAQYLGNHHNRQAIELFNSFGQEIAKPNAVKSVLQALWNEFKAVLPHSSEIASALKIITEIFL